jgi:hypothetical protein
MCVQCACGWCGCTVATEMSQKPRMIDERRAQMRADMRGRKEKIGREQEGRYLVLSHHAIRSRGSFKLSNIQASKSMPQNRAMILDGLIEIYNSPNLRRFRQKRKRSSKSRERIEKRGIKVTVHITSYVPSSFRPHHIHFI